MTADEDWQVDRLREDGDPNHGSDIQRAVDKANKAREQGADVVAIAMHSVQEYLDYADSWQISEAHELADTGAFDVIYGAGCHCAQPIENYNGTWIIYGLGNAVTESANTPETLVNNQGVTARIQFAGKKGVKGSWRVNRIDWVPTANVHQGNYQWCPISSDHPIVTCWDEATTLRYANASGMSSIRWARTRTSSRNGTSRRSRRQSNSCSAWSQGGEAAR